MNETLAERECRAHGFDPVEVFRNQYRIAPAGTPPLPFFEVVTIGDWQVSLSEHLHRCLLKDASGTVCGIVLGHAVTGDGQHMSGDFALEVAMDAPEFLDSAELLLKWSAGRFCALVACPAGARIYTDPAASFGVVFDPVSRAVASSLLLALTRPIENNPAFDNAAIVGDDPFGGTPEHDDYSGLYGFGLTRDRLARRVIANHYLDLAAFAPHRFWPRGDDLDRFAMDRAGLADLVISRLGATVAALAANTPSLFLLSGGYDSKMVLAAARDTIAESPNVEAFVFAATWNQTLDVAVARALGEQQGVRVNEVVPDEGHRGAYTGAAEAERKALAYVLATGSIGPMPPAERRGFLDQLPDDTILITGNMLEIASAVWWPPAGTDDRTHALKRSMVAQNSDAERRDRERRFDAWEASLPEAAREKLHDFNYVENTLPNTQGVHLGVTGQFRVPPANDRAIFAASMAAPVRWRRRRGLYNAVVSRACPELHEIPTVWEIKAAAKRHGASIDDLLAGDLRDVRRMLDAA